MDRKSSPRRFRGRLRALLPAAVLIGVAGCAAGPEVRTEVRSLRGIDLSHTNVVEYVVGEGKSPDIIVEASGEEIPDVLAEEGLRLYFRERGTERFAKVIMGAAGSPSRFSASIPAHDPGTWVDYYIEVRGKGGELLTFPGSAGHGTYYSLRFKGRVPPALVALHAALMSLALLLFLLASWRAWRFLKSGGPSGEIDAICAGGLVSLFLGGFPVGVLAGWYAHGTLWTGFPVGGDVTDTKTLIVFAGWLVVVALLRRSRPGVESTGDEARRRRDARLVIAGTILTALVYAIPHGI